VERDAIKRGEDDYKPMKEKENGKGVAAAGAPAIDPTANVIALNEAAGRRQDDLRNLMNALTEAKLAHLAEIVRLNAEHAREINSMESNRLNSIRQVDVLAVNTAADRAAQAIAALAATTAANAENLRNALNTTAQTIATQTANTVSAITERISALEKSSYEGKGKQAVSDPQMAEMLSELKSLRDSRSTTTGKSEGISAAWVMVITVVSIIAAIVVGLAAAYIERGPAIPQVIYTPGPVQESQAKR
jgi:hypothetical protein